jgi:hypothetical protein
VQPAYQFERVGKKTVVQDADRLEDCIVSLQHCADRSTDSPARIDHALPKTCKGMLCGHSPSDSRDKEGWYLDSPAGTDKSLYAKTKDMEGWYSDSPAGIDKTLRAGARDEGWYEESPAGADRTLHVKDKGDKGGWYIDFLAGVDKSIDVKHKVDKEGWYTDSPAGLGKSIHAKYKEDKKGWYVDSPAGVDESLHRIHKENSNARLSKKDYEINLRSWIYENVCTEPLRNVSDLSSSLFAYEVHPRHDVVDRWHVPIEPRKSISYPMTRAV